jgi:hypothetical protein
VRIARRKRGTQTPEGYRRFVLALPFELGILQQRAREDTQLGDAALLHRGKHALDELVRITREALDAIVARLPGYHEAWYDAFAGAVKSSR